jgi:hypothetical protein
VRKEDGSDKRLLITQIVILSLSAHIRPYGRVDSDVASGWPNRRHGCRTIEQRRQEIAGG